ncbi:hypothetical protein MSG28_000686 [Choristoneura fumiferana]|uniref:Uncharacterized protein n=1 Tax=Choristoneura fumiferana TaxID=7141 RepID=A0ACC0K2I5_CHOFU|nr:hypothetical protein MSG28_000686 [Choristoneura fumiferana]
MAEIRELFHEGLREVTPQRWQSSIDHVIKVKDEMCKLDGLITGVVDKFVIHVTESDSDITDKLFSQPAETTIGPIKTNRLLHYRSQKLDAKNTVGNAFRKSKDVLKISHFYEQLIVELMNCAVF